GGCRSTSHQSGRTLSTRWHPHQRGLGSYPPPALPDPALPPPLRLSQSVETGGISMRVSALDGRHCSHRQARTSFPRRDDHHCLPPQSPARTVPIGLRVFHPPLLLPLTGRDT